MKDSKIIEKKYMYVCVGLCMWVHIFIVLLFWSYSLPKVTQEKKMHRLSSSKWTRVLMAFGLLDSELILWEEI